MLYRRNLNRPRSEWHNAKSFLRTMSAGSKVTATGRIAEQWELRSFKAQVAAASVTALGLGVAVCAYFFQVVPLYKIGGLEETVDRKEMQVAVQEALLSANQLKLKAVSAQLGKVSNALAAKQQDLELKTADLSRKEALISAKNRTIAAQAIEVRAAESRVATADAQIAKTYITLRGLVVRTLSEEAARVCSVPLRPHD